MTDTFNRNDSWLEYQKLVLTEIERLSKSTDKLIDIVSKINYGDIPSLERSLTTTKNEIREEIDKLKQTITSINSMIVSSNEDSLTYRLIELEHRLLELNKSLDSKPKESVDMEIKKATLIEQIRGSQAIQLALVVGVLNIFIEIIKLVGHIP